MDDLLPSSFFEHQHENIAMQLYEKNEDEKNGACYMKIENK